MNYAAAWLLAFMISQWQADLPLLIALIFAHRFLGLEVEFWFPKFLTNGVKDL
jgi:hypothetical protein